MASIGIEDARFSLFGTLQVNVPETSTYELNLMSHFIRICFSISNLNGVCVGVNSCTRIH